MAKLTNEITGNQIVLQAQHTFGRHSENCTTVLDYTQVSRLHAIITWDGECWAIKDNSTNGTFINNEALTTGKNRLLVEGDTIQFGDIRAEQWTVSSLDPPQAMLQPLTGQTSCIILNNIIALPSDETPEITLYINKVGRWVCESQAGTALLRSGDIVGSHNQTWRFIDGTPSTKTTKNEVSLLASNNIRYLFDVSQNEEHVSLSIEINNKKFNFGERSHHYLLLILARKRLEDKNLGVTQAEQGWMDKSILMNVLRLSENHINILIHRFRKQLTESNTDVLIVNGGVERRFGVLRLAYANILIHGGALRTPQPSATHAAID